MENLKFIWIDDDPDRKSAAENMENSLTVKVDFVDVKHKNLESKIDELVKGSEPNLIILDHNLHDIQDGYFKAGSTAATIIREGWASCPIICISGADKSYFDAQMRSIYDAIFSISDIASHYQTILSIAESYRKLKASRPANIDQLMSLLNEPDEEIDRLKSIVPVQINRNLGDPSIWKEISQ